MINLVMFHTREELAELTGLSMDDHCSAMWEAGFNLDDWDVGFASDVPMTVPIPPEDREEWEDDDAEEATEEASFLVRAMENYCIGYNHVEYGGKHYYTVHHV